MPNSAIKGVVKSMHKMCKVYTEAYARADGVTAAEFARIEAKEINSVAIIGKGYRRGLEKFMIELNNVLNNVAMKHTEGSMDLPALEKIEQTLQDIAEKNL